MPYKVSLTVKEVRGTDRRDPCPYYKVGDKITFQHNRIIKEESDYLCIYALSAVLPYLPQLGMDTPPEHSISRRPGKHLQCPDEDRPVVFEIIKEYVPSRSLDTPWVTKEALQRYATERQKIADAYK